MAVDAPRGVWGDKSPEQRGRATWPGRCLDAGEGPVAYQRHAMRTPCAVQSRPVARRAAGGRTATSRAAMSMHIL
jgi:hypothetical protein